MKKVSIIFGAPGIGKTTVAKILYQKILDSQYIDVDELWRINPFIVNDENKGLVETNLRQIYQSFYKHETLKHLIITWVVPTEGLRRLMLDWFCECQVEFYRLIADEDIYLDRLLKDHRDIDKFNDYVIINSKNEFKNIKTIDVTNLNASEVIDKLYQEMTKEHEKA